MDKFGIYMINRLFFLLLLVSQHVWAEDDNPKVQIEGFHDSLIQVMQSETDFEGRSSSLRDEVEELFSLETIARISVGRMWRALEQKQKADFVDLLSTLIISTYADRFTDYQGQKFRTVSAEETSRGWVVKTEMVRANKEIVRLDYYFLNGGVFNVVADGVSDLSLRRADYNSIIKSEGFLALLSHLRQKIDEYSE